VVYPLLPPECSANKAPASESAEAAERISRVLPRVKLIFLIRYPVERAFSNYLWSPQNGLECETFERATGRTL
jgi:hypothetical protein